MHCGREECSYFQAAGHVHQEHFQWNGLSLRRGELGICAEWLPNCYTFHFSSQRTISTRVGSLRNDAFFFLYRNSFSLWSFSYITNWGGNAPVTVLKQYLPHTLIPVLTTGRSRLRHPGSCYLPCSQALLSEYWVSSLPKALGFLLQLGFLQTRDVLHGI